MHRRRFLATALAAPAAALAQATAETPVPAAIRNLKPMTAGVVPIGDAERQARVEKARRLMRENNLAALVCEAGASLYYFTGVRASPVTWVLPARGEPAWVVPPAGRDAARAAIPAAADFQPAASEDAAFEILAGILRERGAAAGRIGIEEKARFALFDGLRKQAPAAEFVNAVPVTAGCRMIKSPAELALLKRANDITIAAYRAVFSALREGMTNGEVSLLVAVAYHALGVEGDAMAIFGKYTAFPHGSIQPQRLREGDVVLVDDGCTVEGYQSDITRTIVFGAPTARQRDIWNLERKAQDAALAAARPGATCESVDTAARKVLADAGFGPGYKVPGLPHRTGHGIGLEGHEWTYLVKGNQTKLAPGMCFSNEPTIVIPGEFGVRLEDCMYITVDGARMFTRQSPAIDQPFG